MTQRLDKISLRPKMKINTIAQTKLGVYSYPSLRIAENQEYGKDKIRIFCPRLLKTNSSLFLFFPFSDFFWVFLFFRFFFFYFFCFFFIIFAFLIWFGLPRMLVSTGLILVSPQMLIA